MFYIIPPHTHASLNQSITSSNLCFPKEAPAHVVTKRALGLRNINRIAFAFRVLLSSLCLCEVQQKTQRNIAYARRPHHHHHRHQQGNVGKGQMYKKKTKHNASSSSSSTQPHRGDQDQISRTMGLFSMTNLRHMLVHRYASLLGRTHTHTHTHSSPISHTHHTRRATVLSPVH